MSVAAALLKDHRPPAETGRPWWDETRATSKLALPLILAQLAQMAIGTTDVVMTGWLGPEKLAAGTLATNYMFPMFFLGMGILAAVAPLISQALGARQFRGVRRSVRQGLWAGLAIALPYFALLYFSTPIMGLLGQQPQAVLLAEGYLRAVLVSVPFVLWLIPLRIFIAAHGKAHIVLVSSTTGFLLNILGNYALMFGNFGFPRLELVGAAISSVLVNIAMFAVLLGYCLTQKRLRRYHILARWWRPDWTRFRTIFRIGMPFGLTNLAEVGLFSAASFLIGTISIGALAAHAIALQCAALSFMVPYGLAQATTIRVGLKIGAQDRPGVRRAGLVSLLMGLGYASTAALLFALAGNFIAGLFLDRSDPAALPVIGIAVQLLVIAAIFQLFDATQTIALGALRGLRDTAVPMVIAIFGYWGLGFPAAIALGFWVDLGEGWSGVYGVWLGFVIGLASVALCLTARFLSRTRPG
ncbi:MAG: MATE family efflux transporter [Alphaproteobacteria bacterium]|nr:MATE family efflux transporter [Alphaproteobacteria bacterium]